MSVPDLAGHEWLALGIFMAGLVAFTLEERLLIHKAATAMILAPALWVLYALSTSEDVEEQVYASTADMVGIFLFLFSAMGLVGILDRYGFFDVIKNWLYRRSLGDLAQFWLVSIITFAMSAILDNLTTTLVMVAVANEFFKGSNRLVVISMLVIAANAGGALSPIGDVTTIMIWGEGKFAWWEVIAYASLPSATKFLVTGFLLSRKLTGNTADVPIEKELNLTKGDKLVVIYILSCFSLPLAATAIGVAPFLLLGGGYGIALAITGSHLGQKEEEETSLAKRIEDLLGRIEFASLAFFAGILLAVGALEHMGVLDAVVTTIIGRDPSTTSLASSAVVLGLLSAMVDNVPLTAIALNTIHVDNPEIWSLLAFCVGTGGSHLIIGSAAGVVAMDKSGGDVTFWTYVRIATLPVFIGYVAGVAVWVAQFNLV